MLSSIKTNWASMTDTQRRKLTVSSVVVLVVVIIFMSLPSRKPSSSGSDVSESEVALESIDLQSAPDNKWLDRAVKNSAARHRIKLKEEIDLLAEKITDYQAGTSSDLGEIKISIKALTRATKDWELEVARERVQRKAADKMILSKMDGVDVGGVLTQEGDPVSNSSLNIPTVSSGSGISMEESVVKVSPFDMISIARLNRLSLNSPQSSNIKTADVESIKTVNVKESANRNMRNNDNGNSRSHNQVSNQQIDRRGNIGDGEIELETKPKPKEAKSLAKVPTGSIIQARLVTGLNAVIANTADSDKLIVLAKLTAPILYPNNKSISLRGCTLMGSGKGDVSTERVYINSTILSCIDSDDILYEATVKSNAIGEDGVLGLRGRPVTKDGALIMQSVGTGLIQGFASAFSGASNQPQIVSSGDGQFQLPSADYVAKSGLASGVDKGLEQMVKRANGLLDQIFPVLEIDAGRSIEFIVQQSFELKEI